MGSRRSRRRRGVSRKKGGGKWLFWGLGGLVAILLLGAVVGYGAIRSYLKSDDFRVMLGERAGTLLKGDAEFEKFEWDGWNVSTERFSFSGKDSVEQLRAHGIDADVDIGAIWRRAYRIEDIRLREVELIVDLRDRPRGKGDEDIAGHSEDALGEPIDGQGSGFLSGFLPNSLEVDGINISAVGGRVLTDDGMWVLKDSSVNVEQGSGENVYDLRLFGGEIAPPPALKAIHRLAVKEVKGRYADDQFHLLSSQFDVLDDGKLSMDGGFDLVTKSWTVHGEVRDARIEELVAEDWKKRLTGPLEVDFEVNGRPDFETRLDGELVLNEGVLTALPVLDKIAAYTGNPRFHQLALSESRMNFRKIGDALELKDILFASEGLLRIEGGEKFMVGVTPGTLVQIPGAETKVFKRGKLGLMWAPVRVSGTLSDFKEDLSRRLLDAAAERMIEFVPETGQYVYKLSGKVVEEGTKVLLEEDGVLGKIGDQTIRAVEGLLDDPPVIDPSDLIEGGTGLLKKGANGVFDLLPGGN